ncbi:tyrosine-type recombinase/integrase [Pseudonocardia sp. T1-2H]|uniref:tyrosine-type recombinase/integrase n=1 Tax=Pseudonocardia sp. T1-2H TaxID=3128899 RepID=UPI003101A937
MNTDQLRRLSESWTTYLRSQNKSKSTVKSYLTGVTQFLSWCDAGSREPTLTKATVNAWVADMLGQGAQAKTAAARQFGVRRFSMWLAEEEEIPRDELVGVKPVKFDQKITPTLSHEETRALLDACKGKLFHDFRDRAVVSVLLDTGIRAGECVNLATSDVNLKTGEVVVRRGKGGKGRMVLLTPDPLYQLDRYLRKRRDHRLSSSPALWLGGNGQGFSYAALHKALKRRADAAGLKDFHPHVLRHTFATRWLDDGGDVENLRALAGWEDLEMVARYTRTNANMRALDAAREMGERRSSRR